MKKCKICSNRFEPTRSDARYCSNACKQKAHNLRKNEVQQADAPKLVFYHDEYQEVCNMFGLDYESLPFMFYCFLRKGIPLKATVQNVYDYINSVWHHNNYDQILKTNAYRNFIEDFLGGEFIILSNKS